MSHKQTILFSVIASHVVLSDNTEVQINLDYKQLLLEKWNALADLSQYLDIFVIYKTTPLNVGSVFCS